MQACIHSNEAFSKPPKSEIKPNQTKRQNKTAALEAAKALYVPDLDSKAVYGRLLDEFAGYDSIVYPTIGVMSAPSGGNYRVGSDSMSPKPTTIKDTFWTSTKQKVSFLPKANFASL